MGIHELLINDEDIKVLIKKRAPTEEIRERAILNGMTTLKQDGIAKVFQGFTDIKEVRRVCIK
jgi:type II secretory ATPase GspE/PulE/Tfp pilus assembly ATPase PilB-like protein